MEPDIMEVGATLEEAKSLRREHDEILLKLNVSLFNLYNFYVCCRKIFMMPFLVDSTALFGNRAIIFVTVKVHS